MTFTRTQAVFHLLFVLFYISTTFPINPPRVLCSCPIIKYFIIRIRIQIHTVCALSFNTCFGSVSEWAIWQLKRHVDDAKRQNVPRQQRNTSNWLFLHTKILWGVLRNKQFVVYDIHLWVESLQKGLWFNSKKIKGKMLRQQRNKEMLTIDCSDTHNKWPCHIYVYHTRTYTRKRSLNIHIQTQ